MNNRTRGAWTVAMAFLFLAGGGCTDTLVQPKSTISEGNVFADVGSYKKFLAKIYAGLAAGRSGTAGHRSDRLP